MSDLIQRIKHLLYRVKTDVFSQSRPALWIKNKVWNKPADGTVEVLFREDQNILKYFNWEMLDDPIAREKLKEFTERYAHEPDIIYRIKGNIIIEPEYALAINEGRQFIPQSGTLSHLSLRPALFSYLKRFYFVREYTHYDTLIHCDGFAGVNLCHFIYETINPILLLHQKGMISEQDPVLISEKIYNTAFFQYFLKNTIIGKLNWVTQKKNEWIKVKEFRKAFASMETFKVTYELLKSAKKPSRRIFLNRKSYYQRNIRNIEGLTAILTRYGFDLIFAEDLNYEEQVKLFSEVKYFVGIHGAGLTNLLHADIPSLHVLEIFSESLVHASFFRFLKILNIRYYDAIVGSKFDLNWNYSVDEAVFELKIKKLISQ